MRLRGQHTSRISAKNKPLIKNKLKEAVDYAKAIGETMHESLLILGEDLKVRNANKAFYQTFNLRPKETEGLFIYDIGNHQWNIPKLMKQLKMLRTKNIPFWNFEVTHIFPQTGIKTLLLNAHRFQVKDCDSPLILLAIQDLTERKQIEERLKESEERFRLLIQNASDTITVFDSDGTIKYESPAIKTLLGYTPEERIGRNISIDPIVHPEDKKIKIDLFKRSIKRPRENIYGEFRLKHKNGTYRTIDAIFRNLLGEKKINGIIANYRDITERKLLEQQKDEFIGIASHELKTPVTSIKAYTQILQGIFQDANDLESAVLLGKLNTQVDRLAILIKDLLDFTRVESGKLMFRKEKYEMNELIEEIINEIQPTTKHSIETKLSKPVKIKGDRYRTGQVLSNLISNAIKYSPKANQIIVSSKKAGKTITVSVQDFGIGIEPKLLTKVFDRFFRITKSSASTFPGLGLGLYIASEFVHRQGGRIWVTSNNGKGSTFSFSLPIDSKK